MSAIDTYLGRNAKYSAGFTKGGLRISPAGRIAIVACMDARLEMAAALGLGVGEAHVIRNAGGVVTDDVVRSLALSQRLADTREIMLIHHTDCGMLRFTDEQLEEAIEKDTGIRPHFAIEAFSNLEESVRRSIARLEASPFVSYKHAIRGFVYEVETGRLREVEKRS